MNGDDPRIAELGKFTLSGTLTPGYGDHYLFFVGRDDVHGILCYMTALEHLAYRLNMFGYDDDTLNRIIMSKIANPNIYVQISLDQTQAGGVHERKLLEANAELDPVNYANSFAIIKSATRQIDHTKGGVCSGLGMGFEGSTNWSASGEGTGISIVPGKNNAPGFKAQNNTLLVSTNPVFLSRFSAQLDVEHRTGVTYNKEHS
jgi:hypothetical protein